MKSALILSKGGDSGKIARDFRRTIATNQHQRCLGGIWAMRRRKATSSVEPPSVKTPESALIGKVFSIKEEDVVLRHREVGRFAGRSMEVHGVAKTLRGLAFIFKDPANPSGQTFQVRAAYTDLNHLAQEVEQ